MKILLSLATALMSVGLASIPLSVRAAEVSVTTPDEVFARVAHDPERLRIFMRNFPKGADLHNHLSGAIYAESMLDWAAKDGLCVSLKDSSVLAKSCPHPAPGQIAARDVSSSESIENQMIDALSMRDFVPTGNDRSGHDHFFATFGRFDALERDHQGDMLAEALDRAASDHITYVELMVSPGLGKMIAAGAHLPLSGDDFTKAHAALLPQIPALVQQARADTDQMEKQAQAVLKCNTAEAHPGCGVAVRYLFQTLRILPPGMVYAQLDAGYATVKADPRFVGVNIVAPEDDPISMRDYDLHMKMFRFLNGVYPGVNLSLHAGELTLGLVPTDGLRHHIRAAIEVAGAKRIGHGVDVASEDNTSDLLAEMARQHVMVEINLTSNDEILGVRGAAHPFSLYRRAGVPMAFSTDDEGVSRGDLTQEYLRAVQTYDLSYSELRQFSRTGLEYAFVPGESLWQDHQIGQTVEACHGIKPAIIPAEGPCASFLKSSEKARLQWSLEMRMLAFENSVTHEVLFQ